jgi:glutamate racemase
MKIFLKRTIICLAIGLQLPIVNAQNTLKIEDAILNDKKSYYYVDFNNYPKSLQKLPIGMFDSGTGGLTVLDALVNFDDNNNATHVNQSDGKLDFAKEKFVYLADQANMPYGNYNSVGKDDLLKEHIIKDFQFLFGNKYYDSSLSKLPTTDKEQVKAIVIACNTATAYGYVEAMNFIAKTGIDVPVVGVINAAVKGTLSKFSVNENGSIGVFATVGTISSKGYEKTLKEEIKKNKYTGNIQIFNQGGHGLAEAVDEELDFVSIGAISPRTSYRGPSLSNDNYKIEKALLDVYNFNFDKNKMLYNSANVEDCDILQLNDSENYVRYHLVSLVEKMRKSQKAEPLKALILGCTHYPYLTKEINQVLDELRNYQDKSGNYVYKNLIYEQVYIIDPSVYVASELYDILRERDLFNTSGDMFKQSKFYISVPNVDNELVQLDENGKFTYEYKYGRTANDIQEYVKIVPFDSNNISSGTYERFQKLIPNTYQMIMNFNKKDVN